MHGQQNIKISSSRVSYNINTARFLHVSTTLVASITEVFEPMLKRKIESFKTYGLKPILQYKKTEH
jgi:hemoglobin-like flavoprotein